MTATRHYRPHSEAGQALVIAVFGLVAMLALAALVVDGGNAWAQWRLTQNGTDAASEAGAVVIADYLAQTQAGVPVTATDASVLAAITTSATANTITIPTAYYTDYQGNLLTSAGVITTNTASAAVVGDVGAIPPNAQGVQAGGQKSFRTYFAGIAGIGSLNVGASATAVAGGLTGIGANPLLPITFPVVVSTCAGNGSLQPGTSYWPIIEKANANASNESIVPLCKNGPGAVGWLDFGCGTLAFQISNPCNVAFSIPTWIQTTPGNPNNVDSEMNAYDGDVITLPLFDGTCKIQPPGTALGDCPGVDTGVGNNTWYHIPWFVGFLLDHAYIQGNNHPECNQAPGGPPVGGNGGTGCLKGWFVKLILQGPVGQGVGGNIAGAIGVQLIK